MVLKDAARGCLRADSAGVAVGAVDLRKISEIHRVLEGRHRICGDAGRAFGLRHQGMALVAVFADHLAIGADVLSVVAAETSDGIVVSQVVGVGLPVQLHFRERGAAEDLLNLGHCVANFQLLRLRHIGIFTLGLNIPAGRSRCRAWLRRWCCSSRPARRRLPA